MNRTSLLVLGVCATVAADGDRVDCGVSGSKGDLRGDLGASKNLAATKKKKGK